MDIIKSYFQSLAPISDEEFQYFLSKTKVKEFNKGDYFCEQGEQSHIVGFVLQGVFRVYYMNQDGDITIRNFSQEGKPVGSLATILTSEPAHVYIEALEKSQVATIPYKSFESLFERSHSWERLGRKIAEVHFYCHLHFL